MHDLQRLEYLLDNEIECTFPRRIREQRRQQVETNPMDQLPRLPNPMVEVVVPAAAPTLNTILLADDGERAIRAYAALVLHSFHPVIAGPEIEAERFELKPVMFQMLQTVGKFFGNPCEDSHLHLRYFLEIKNFYNGLSEATRLVVDASANRALLSKSYVEAIDILERISANNYHWSDSRADRSNHGVNDNERASSRWYSSTEGTKSIPRVYTLTELKTATRNFRPDNMVGDGGFERIFKGWVDDVTYAPSKVGVGIAVAVTKSNPYNSPGLCPCEWKREVGFLAKLRHPNVEKLIGYCYERKQLLLVYEYMPKWSLEYHLFRGVEPLSWDTRIKIAIGAARGLTYLHMLENNVIYYDFKPSNILLDGDFNPKLSNFGLTKLGPSNGNSHVSTKVIGTYGYVALEYIATGHLYTKSDVYGFGVVLLELLTGLRAVDPNRPSGSYNLVGWAGPLLTTEKKIKKLMDPRLGEDYSPKGAWAATVLVFKCLESDPGKRPSMEEVLENLEKVSTYRDRPKEPKSNVRTPTRYGFLGSLETLIAQCYWNSRPN
ncbi:probable serine/threonine-protein kinase PBL11 [Momordica charantia]|uniref:Probable serine/threonine-protein kinase PBL11 n=1 Tax=Momordica charantia TaxID=3673 RepID=A0A6J1DI54_MOMCH|nr:probable serine/threonine-protein kinase PBL11 [Momordica charantia]